MTLQQMFDWCNKKSYFSRDEDEVWEAIDTAGLQLYTEVLNENKGYFWVWDLTSLSIIANQDEYQLPAACENLVRIRERLSPQDPWRVLMPADINSDTVYDSQYGANFSEASDNPESQFVYSGPYERLSEAVAQTYVKSIKLAPVPVDGPRTCELLYTGKWVSITGAGSYNLIDTPGHNAQKYLAVAELFAANDDDNAERFEGKGSTHKTQYLKLVRARQQQQGKQCEPYLDDLD